MLYFLGAAMTLIILPRIESLHQTRGDSPGGRLDAKVASEGGPPQSRSTLGVSGKEQL